MQQSLTDSPTGSAPGLPSFISVSGLKHSGKTTVVEALVSELSALGHEVGTIKTMRDHVPSLSAEGTDTRRHEEAGASVVVALHAGGTARFERGVPPRTLEEAARLFPARIRIVVCEGTLEPTEGQIHVVCLRTAQDLDATLSKRRIPTSVVAALSGIGASTVTGTDIPRFDVMIREQRRKLALFILERIEEKKGTRP